jgi:hypothetical protein
MSRIPAREVIIASGAVSAVVSLCLLGTVAAGTPAAANAESAASSSSVLQHSTSDVGDPGVMAGSYRGVWFNLAAHGATKAIALDEAADLAKAEDALATSAQDTTAATKPKAGSAVAATRTQLHSAAVAPVSGPPRSIAQSLAAKQGWTGQQWTCLDDLWSHESKYETTVRNPKSGAYGIPQALPASKMASAGDDWRTNPATQIQWGLGYISTRYSSPCGAWSYWLSHGYY